MTADHLKVLLDDTSACNLLCAAGQELAAANVPEEIVAAVRLGRLTALQ